MYDPLVCRGSHFVLFKVIYFERMVSYRPRVLMGIHFQGFRMEPLVSITKPNKPKRSRAWAITARMKAGRIN